MNAQPIAIADLLREPESDWLDWKADFPPGLLGGKTHPQWDHARAKVLRVLVAIANSMHDRCGYVVFGVDNSTSPRSVSGITKSFDDASFQDWSQLTIRPRIRFLYREENLGDKTVGIFEISPSSDYPHVVERKLAEVLADGQVWIRRGSRCTVAHSDDLRRMCEPQEPVTVANPDGPLVRLVRELWEPLGWDTVLPSHAQKADCLASGHRMAYVPGTRREIHFRNNVLLLRRKGTG